MSLTIEGSPLSNDLRQSFTIERNPLHHIIEIHPLLHKETPYYGRNTFPYYRRKSLNHNDNIQGNRLL